MRTLFITFHFVYSFLLFLPLIALAKEISYEPNNTLEDAVPIDVDWEIQEHKFDYAGDEDWLVFYAQKRTLYNIKIDSVAEEVNPALTLFDENDVIVGVKHDINFTGKFELLAWEAPTDGFYYIRVSNEEPIFSANGHYTIEIFLPLEPIKGRVKGEVIDQCTQKKLGTVKISAKDELVNTVNRFKLSHKNGGYSIPLLPGDYTITANFPGYQNTVLPITIEEAKSTPLQIELQPEGGCSIIIDPRPDLEILRQQAVGIFDEQSGLLTLKEVQVGNQIYTASLQKQADFSFKLTSVTLTNFTVLLNPAFYNPESSLLDIPKVFAFDQLYEVQLKQISDEFFTLEKAEPL